MLTDPVTAAELSDVPCSSVLCRSRDVELTDAVEVDSLKATDDGWLGHGVIHLNYCVHGRCRTCGRVFEAARTQIPVQFPELSCRTCGKSERLQFRVDELERCEDGYRFAVTIRCAECSGKGTVVKMLKGLLGGLSIEVGLTGISVKAAAKGHAG